MMARNMRYILIPALLLAFASASELSAQNLSDYITVQQGQFKPDIDLTSWTELIEWGGRAEELDKPEYAISYFTEAFRVNPYDPTPLEHVEEINKHTGRKRENKQLFLDGMEQLTERIAIEGLQPETMACMERLLMGVVRADGNNIPARYYVLKLCNQSGFPEYADLAASLMDDLIYLADDKTHYDEYAYAVGCKLLTLTEVGDMIGLIEPNVSKLEKSEDGVCSLVALSLLYGSLKNKHKAEKYMKMAQKADKSGESVDYWMAVFAGTAGAPEE